MAAPGEEIFTLTASIKAAVAHINEFPQKKLNRLVGRILDKLHLAEEKPFTDEEEAQLTAAFEVTDDALQLVLETLAFVFETAAYHQMSPKKLAKHLSVLTMGADQVEVVAHVWGARGAGVVANLRDRAFFTSQLGSVNWQLNVQLGQGNKAAMRDPNAVLSLGVGSGGKESENVQIEMSHAELFGFYSKLEIIQAQLDQLS